LSTTLGSYFEPAPANCCAVSKRGLGAGHAAFSPIGLVAVPICAGPNPAVVEIGKERGSAEAASQRADAALSWNTLEGGGLDSFSRLGTDRVAVGLHLRPIA
jgi:hypothetical protein